MEKIVDLGLSEESTENISAIILEHKMLWEPWMESAKDFQELKRKLKERGIKSVPMHASPVNKQKETTSEKNVIKDNKKSMLRKKKN